MRYELCLIIIIIIIIINRLASMDVSLFTLLGVAVRCIVDRLLLTSAASVG